MEIEVIHAFIEGKLEGVDLQSFKSRLASDSDLALEVKVQREMLKHLHILEENEAAQQAINQVHVEYENEEVEKPSRRWFLVAVIFFILLLLLLLFRMLNSSELAGEPALQFAEAPELPLASFGTKGSTSDEFLSKASIAFNNKEYAVALKEFNSAIESGSSNVGEIEFYKALSLLGDGNYEQAITSFSKLKIERPMFSKDADWYLAMSYWYSGDRASAKNILQKFTSGNYQQKAKLYLQSPQ